MGTAFDIKSVKGCLLWEEGQPPMGENARQPVPSQAPPVHPDVGLHPRKLPGTNQGKWICLLLI